MNEKRTRFYALAKKLSIVMFGEGEVGWDTEQSCGKRFGTLVAHDLAGGDFHREEEGGSFGWDTEQGRKQKAAKRDPSTPLRMKICGCDPGLEGEPGAPDSQEKRRRVEG